MQMMHQDSSGRHYPWADLQGEHESSDTEDAGGGEGSLQVGAGTGGGGRRGAGARSGRGTSTGSGGYSVLRGIYIILARILMAALAILNGTNVPVVAVTSAVSVASPAETVEVAAAKEVVAVSMHPW